MKFNSNSGWKCIGKSKSSFTLSYTKKLSSGLSWVISLCTRFLMVHLTSEKIKNWSKFIILFLTAFLLSLCIPTISFQIHHRHKNKGAHPKFQKIKKTEMLRLRQKKLYALEKSILRRRDSKSMKKSLARELHDGVKLSQKQHVSAIQAPAKKKTNCKVFFKLFRPFQLSIRTGLQGFSCWDFGHVFLFVTCEFFDWNLALRC